MTSDPVETGLDGQGRKPEVKLSVSNARKIYPIANGWLEALAGVSVDVIEGHFVSLLGPTGCGKTTLLWAMAGLHSLTEGTVILEGAIVTRPRPERAGMVFQEANLLPWRSIRKNIEFPFEIRHKKVDDERIDHLLMRTGLDGFQDAYPRQLSGGMQQRASIVRALAQDPEVLFMDEPFSALDAFSREEMNDLFVQLWSEADKTAVFVTHNIDEAVFLSDEVVVMTPRPGRVARVFAVDLPRPRLPQVRFDPRFIRLTQEIKVSISGDSVLGNKPEPADGAAND